MSRRLYEEDVAVTRVVSAIAGPGKESTTLAELRKDGPDILRAFADDDDIQEITLCSTNLGMVRKYTKQFSRSNT